MPFSMTAVNRYAFFRRRKYVKLVYDCVLPAHTETEGGEEANNDFALANNVLALSIPSSEE